MKDEEKIYANRNLDIFGLVCVILMAIVLIFGKFKLISSFFEGIVLIILVCLVIIYGVFKYIVNNDKTENPEYEENTESN